jgi:hypothetical protein
MMSATCEPVALVVNDEQVGLSDLLRSIRVADDVSLFERCARQRLIVQLARREGLGVRPEDLQAGVDEWRYQKRLERIEDTEVWLARRGLTLDDVAAEVERRLLRDALAQKVTEGQVEPYFTQHALEFDEAEVCWIHVGEKGTAEEIQMQVAEEGADFYGLARRCSEDEATRPAGGYLGRLRRAQLPKGIAPLVFAAEAGEVVGPVKVGKGYALYFVQQVYPATLNEAVRQEIKGRLFKTWLKREMRQAQIVFPLANSGCNVFLP